MRSVIKKLLNISACPTDLSIVALCEDGSLPALRSLDEGGGEEGGEVESGVECIKN